MTDIRTTAPVTVGDPLTDFRITKLEESVSILASAVDELKTFAVQMKSHVKWGIAILGFGGAVVKPFIEAYLHSKGS